MLIDLAFEDKKSPLFGCSSNFHFNKFLKNISSLINSLQWKHQSSQKEDKLASLKTISPQKTNHTFRSPMREEPPYLTWEYFSLNDFIQQILDKFISKQIGAEKVKTDPRQFFKAIRFDYNVFLNTSVNKNKLKNWSYVDISMAISLILTIEEEILKLSKNQKDFIIRFINFKQIVFHFLKSKFQFLFVILQDKDLFSCIDSLFDSPYFPNPSSYSIFEAQCKSFTCFKYLLILLTDDLDYKRVVLAKEKYLTQRRTKIQVWVYILITKRQIAIWRINLTSSQNLSFEIQSESTNIQQILTKYYSNIWNLYKWNLNSFFIFDKIYRVWSV